MQAELVELVGRPSRRDGAPLRGGRSQRSRSTSFAAPTWACSPAPRVGGSAGARRARGDGCSGSPARAAGGCCASTNALFASVPWPPLGRGDHVTGRSILRRRQALRRSAPRRDERRGVSRAVGGHRYQRSRHRRPRAPPRAARRIAAARLARLYMPHAEGRRAGARWRKILLRRFTALGDYLEGAARSAQVPAPRLGATAAAFFAAQEGARPGLGAGAARRSRRHAGAGVGAALVSSGGVSDETLARMALAGKRLRTSLSLGYWQGFAGGAARRRTRAQVEKSFTLASSGKLRRPPLDRLGPAACVRALIDGAAIWPPVLAHHARGASSGSPYPGASGRARARLSEAEGGDLREFVALAAATVSTAGGAEGHAATGSGGRRARRDVVRRDDRSASGQGAGVSDGVRARLRRQVLSRSITASSATTPRWAWACACTTSARRRHGWTRAASRRVRRGARAPAAEPNRCASSTSPPPRAKDVVIFSGEPVRGAGDSLARAASTAGRSPQLLQARRRPICLPEPDCGKQRRRAIFAVRRRWRRAGAGAAGPGAAAAAAA